MTTPNIAPGIAVPVDTLVRIARGVQFNVNTDDLERIAHVALCILQEEIRQHPNVTTDMRSLQPYEQRAPSQREALRAHVYRVMQALVALGWIAKPD